MIALFGAALLYVCVFGIKLQYIVCWLPLCVSECMTVYNNVEPSVDILHGLHFFVYQFAKL